MTYSAVVSSDSPRCKQSDCNLARTIGRASSAMYTSTGPESATAYLSRQGLRVATDSAMSRASQLLHDLGGPPITPTAWVVQSDSMSQSGRSEAAWISHARRVGKG